MTGRLKAVLFWTYLAAIVVGWFLLVTAVLANRAAIQKSDRALCSLRADYTARSGHLQQILRDHPDGTVDFTAPYLKARIASYQVDIASLADITCNEGAAP
jgi:hypothetical protein